MYVSNYLYTVVFRKIGKLFIIFPALELVSYNFYEAHYLSDLLVKYLANLLAL